MTGAYVKYGALKAEACPIISTFYRLNGSRVNGFGPALGDIAIVLP